ncbi:MAG: pyridoxal phosphate-dependent aminotransferase [Synergistaceae bacterium]|nr:pyridoxal phosphate-dependent aminotransferase [Synergistaceae bacterium]
MKLSNRFGSLKPSGMAKYFRMIEAVDGVCDLSIGEPDFDTEDDIIEAAMADAKNGYTHYPPLSGYPDVKEAVCNYWQRHHDMKYLPDEVHMCVGGTQSLWLGLQVLTDPGDEVICVEPCFSPYFTQVEWTGGKVIHLPTREENGFAAVPEEIESVITPKTKAIILCSPSNPTGRVMKKEQMEKIAEVVEKHDLFVFSDEIYESLVYGEKFTSFASIPGMRERTLVMSGLSKSHCMTGWRIGFAMGPAEFIRLITLLSVNQTYGLSCVGQRASLYALNNHDAKIAERREIFRERLEYVSERLNNIKGITCAKPEGAMYLFPNIKATGKTSEEFIMTLLNDWKVAALPGNVFGSCGEGYIRIACTQSMDTLVIGMDRIENAMSSF